MSRDVAIHKMGFGVGLRNQNTQRIITGDVELDAKLARMKKGTANKLARYALAKAGRYLVKEIKRKIDPGAKSVRRSIGMSVKGNTAKVGAAVGKAAQASKSAKRMPGKPGVGMSANNVHWYILGTTHRQTKDGHPTGAMPAHPVIKAGASLALPEARRIINRAGLEGLQRELAKLG